jgi:hypothetical protein
MPLIVHIGSYSDGGDAMFNSWTLARDQHCILRESCPSYSNGNIFFPNKNTMLYSETQLSAGLLTLPLYFINNNPLFSYGVWTVASFFFMGWFMYLLVKKLSNNNEFVSIIAGLIFEFAPFRMPALEHLQNISIFYLPLIFLLILKYIDKYKPKYLFGIFLSMTLAFYASWYQMVFILTAVFILYLGLWLFRLIKPKYLLLLIVASFMAILSTYPLAKSYVTFSKANHATFNITDQATYESSLLDYITPYNKTVLGHIVYSISPKSHNNSYNPDSYSYNGLILYAVAGTVIVYIYKNRKRTKENAKRLKILIILSAIGLSGFIISLGPVLKIRGSFLYNSVSSGINFAIPMPYIIVDKLLPQLSFMRSLGRANVLLLFSLCCILGLAPLYLEKYKYYKNNRKIINIIVIILIFVELIPLHLIPIRSASFDHNLTVPPVYGYIYNHKNIDNILILSADADYKGAQIPTALPEDDLWAGYDNRNIFNGYSGYSPPSYYPEYYNFLNFRADVVPQIKSKGIKYILVDKLLSSSNPQLTNIVSTVLGSGHIIYSDNRYDLYKL